MKQYYECHITLLGDKAEIKRAVEKVRWIFSYIDGDPDLGEGVKCYATKHFNIKEPQASVADLLQDTSAQIEWLTTAKVLRKKIEMVLYDERLK